MSLTFLSRTLDPLDYQQLDRELQYVDHHIELLRAPERRWAFALALHAVGRWVANGNHLGETIYDVVIGTSKFHKMMDDWTERDTVVLDALNSHGALNKFCAAGMPLVNVVTAHAVIEHVPDPDRFLYYLSCLLAPGGLLVLTMPFWNHCGADQAYGHAERQRIYCPKEAMHLREQARDLKLSTFGGLDPTWHGAQVHDYTLASLVLEKHR